MATPNNGADAVVTRPSRHRYAGLAPPSQPRRAPIEGCHMPPATADALSPEDAALLLALLPPPPGLVPLSTRRRPLGNTPERVALAWLRRAGEALVAALMALLLLFHIGFTVPEGAAADAPTAESTAPALSPSQAWSVAWADFVAPPVAAQGFGYVVVPVPTMVAVLASLHSTFANAVDVETVDAAAQAVNLNPLLLFACIGAEQPWDLQAAYPSDWRAYAGNPFDIAVYGAWHPTGYTLAESAAISARTLATRLSVAPPGDEPALAWINDPRNPAGRGVYATSPHWWSNVASISSALTQRVVAQARGALSAATLDALGVFVLATGTTPAAVAQALALKVQGTGPLAWVGQTLSDVRAAVYQHTYTLAAGALAAGAAVLGISVGQAALTSLAMSVAGALADLAVAGAVVGGAAA